MVTTAVTHRLWGTRFLDFEDLRFNILNKVGSADWRYDSVIG